MTETTSDKLCGTCKWSWGNIKDWKRTLASRSQRDTACKHCVNKSQWKANPCKISLDEPTPATDDGPRSHRTV